MADINRASDTLLARARGHTCAPGGARPGARRQENGEVGKMRRSISEEAKWAFRIDEGPFGHVVRRGVRRSVQPPRRVNRVEKQVCCCFIKAVARARDREGRSKVRNRDRGKERVPLTLPWRSVRTNQKGPRAGRLCRAPGRSPATYGTCLTAYTVSSGGRGAGTQPTTDPSLTRLLLRTEPPSQSPRHL